MIVPRITATELPSENLRNESVYTAIAVHLVHTAVVVLKQQNAQVLQDVLAVAEYSRILSLKPYAFGQQPRAQMNVHYLAVR